MYITSQKIVYTMDGIVLSNEIMTLKLKNLKA